MTLRKRISLSVVLAACGVMGIQCALCHSTVDNSLAFGIGHRLDGWPNRDLDVGTIVSLAPDLSAVSQLLLGKTDTASQDAVRNVIRQWGPGRFDAEVFMDGKAVNPVTNKTAPTMIPPAFGLAGVNLHTWTGWVPSHTGTRSWPTWRCTGLAHSSTRGSTTRPNFPLRRRTASAT